MSATDDIRPPAARWRRPAQWIGGAVLVAGAVLFLVVLPGNVEDVPAEEAPDPPAGETDGIPTKGPVMRLEIVVEVDGESRRVSTGDAVPAGSRIGFQVATTEPGHLAIFSRSARSGVIVAYPQADGWTAFLDATPDGAILDQAIQLGTMPGFERVVAFLCPEEKRVEPLITGLSDLPIGRPDAPLPRVSASCRQEEVLIVRSVHAR